MIKSLSELKEQKISEVGGKGYSLAILTNKGFNIPKGFIITSELFFDFLKVNDLTERIEKLSVGINEDNFREKSEQVRNLLLSSEIPRGIALEVKDALSKLNVQYVSIRSSAASEDSQKASFAGLFDTFLNVKSDADLVLENVKKCWASLFNGRAVVYRIRKEIPHLEGMAVVVQEMIPAEISGITFTTHPLKEKTLLIEVSYGIGDMIVSGEVEPDDYIVDRETLGIVEKKIGRKDKMNVGEDGSTKVIVLEKALINKQVLSYDKVKEIAKNCLKVEKIFKYPQDIEWCISNNKLWLLQSRAITGVIQ